VSTLCLVPHQQVAYKWRQSAIHAQSGLLPFSIKELVSQLLKEAGMPYRDSVFLEQIALWEAVEEAGSKLAHYSPMVEFPGFIADLHDLFFRYESGDVILEHLSPDEARELNLVYGLYLEKLSASHVLSQARQVEKAVEYWPESRLNQETDRVKLYYLGQLTRLERRLVDAVCRDKHVEHCLFSPQDASVTAVAASSPQDEIELVARAIIDLLNQGVEPQAVAVASPNLESYLPLIAPLFTQYGLPWQPPMPKLADTPVGKAVGTLVRLMQPAWAKVDLEQLTAPGWGLPFALSQEEHKALRIAPPTLRSPEQWRNQLDGHPGWRWILDMLDSIQAEPGLNPVRHYTERLRRVLTELPLTKWPAADHHQWAVLAKAYDGLQNILADLAFCKRSINIAQFEQILADAMSGYTLPQPRSFLQQIFVGAPAQALGMGYHTLFLIGMAEAHFPRPAKRDWLSKQLLPNSDHELYHQLLRSAAYVQLSYAEQDQGDRVHIASQFFPAEYAQVAPFNRLSGPAKPVAVGDGILDEAGITADIAARLQGRQLSVSRLNLYASCPFRFLCSEIYNLEAEDVLVDDITPQTEGALIHETLRLYWQQKQKVPVEEILAEQYGAAGERLTKRVVSMVLAFVRKDRELVETSGYYPTYLEHFFEGLAVQSQGRTIRLRGIIDRIDVDKDGNYVIYDYKTGANPSVKDIRQAHNLQLQVYLLAASRMLPGKAHGIAFYNIKDGRRTGIWLESARQRLRIGKSDGILSDAEWPQLIDEFHQSLKACLDQILNGYFPAAPVREDICSYCPYRAICRKE